VGLPDLNANPIPLVSLRPDVDPHMAGLLERCLSKQAAKRPSAGFVAEALAGSADPALSQGSIFTSPAELLNTLLQRRVPQIVVITFILGVGALSVFGNLADREVVPESFFRLVLSTVVCLLAASWIIAWFHGERGKQKVPCGDRPPYPGGCGVDRPGGGDPPSLLTRRPQPLSAVPVIGHPLATPSCDDSSSSWATNWTGILRC
jgi:hypothetical protein